MADAPIDNALESNSTAQQPTEQSAQTPPNISPPETDVPASIEDQSKPQNTGNNVREWWKVIVETLTLIAVVWYACIAAGQLTQMHKATVAATNAATAAQNATRTEADTLKNSIQSFRVDERAWVEIGNIEKTAYPANPPAFGTTFKFRFYPKNVGKTVATNVTIHLDNIFGNGSLLTNERGIHMFEDQLFKQQGTNKRSITPDKPGPQTLAPGEMSIAPVYAGGQEPKPLGTSYWYGYIIGRIDYIDAFGTRHWKRLCLTVTDANGDLTYCQYGNDEDNNPENPN